MPKMEHISNYLINIFDYKYKDRSESETIPVVTIENMKIIVSEANRPDIAKDKKKQLGLQKGGQEM